MGIGYNCAIEWVDDGFRLLTASDAASAYRVYKRRGELVREDLPKRSEFAPQEELLTI